jgi:hypothetical protein
MDPSQMISCLLVQAIHADARSALPEAPVITPKSRPGRKSTRLAGFRGRVATGLHRAAWWLERASWTGD